MLSHLEILSFSLLVNLTPALTSWALSDWPGTRSCFFVGWRDRLERQMESPDRGFERPPGAFPPQHDGSIEGGWGRGHMTEAWVRDGQSAMCCGWCCGQQEGAVSLLLLLLLLLVLRHDAGGGPSCPPRGRGLPLLPEGQRVRPAAAGAAAW